MKVVFWEDSNFDEFKVIDKDPKIITIFDLGGNKI